MYGTAIYIFAIQLTLIPYKQGYSIHTPPTLKPKTVQHTQQLRSRPHTR